MYLLAEGREAAEHFCTAGYTTYATRPFIRAAPCDLSRLRFAAGAFFVPRMRVGLARFAVCICSRKGAKPQGISARQVKSHARCALFSRRTVRFVSPPLRRGGVFCATNTGGIGAARHTYLFAEGCETAGNFSIAAFLFAPPLRRGGVFVPRIRGLTQCAACICSRKGVKPQGISARPVRSHARHAFFSRLAPRNPSRLRFAAGAFLCRICGWGWRSAPYVFARRRAQSRKAFLHSRSDHLCNASFHPPCTAHSVPPTASLLGNTLAPRFRFGLGALRPYLSI